MEMIDPLRAAQLDYLNRIREINAQPPPESPLRARIFAPPSQPFSLPPPLPSLRDRIFAPPPPNNMPPNFGQAAPEPAGPNLRERIFAPQGEPDPRFNRQPPTNGRVFVGSPAGMYPTYPQQPNPPIDEVRARMTTPRPPLFDFSRPTSFSGAFSPGTRAAAGGVANAAVAAGQTLKSAALPALRVAGAVATPAVELAREGDILFGDDYSTGEKVQAGGRMLARGAGTGIGAAFGGLAGAATPIPGGALGGAVAGGLAGNYLTDQFLDLVGGGRPRTQDEVTRDLLTEKAYARLNQPVVPPAEGNAQNTFGVLASQQNPAAPPPAAPPPPASPTAVAGLPAERRADRPDVLPERPALMGAPAPEPAPVNYDEGPLFTPEAKAQIDKIAARNEELSNLSKQYFEAQGMREPRGLTATDKLQILAKGIGTAALIAAFPGAGLLLALGGGLIGGAEETDARRQANAAADQQDFANTSAIFDQQRGVLGAQIENDQALLKNTNEAYNTRFNRNQKIRESQLEERKFNEDVRRYGLDYAQRERALRQRAAAASQARLIPAVGADGKVRLTAAREGVEVPAGYGGRGALPAAGPRAPSFNYTAEIRERAQMFLEANGNMTPQQALAEAQKSVFDDLQGGGYNVNAPASMPALAGSGDPDIDSELGL